jgi:thioesterase domain-containing protein
VRWLNNYGPTESTVNASAIGYGAGTALPEQVLPIGRPLGNTRLYILDRRLQPVPIGVTGEIHVGGSGIARGYLNQPELTGERFTPDPFSRRTGARLYKSGDLGRWLPDGTIEYIGRNDFQIKLRGFRIEPGEIEARLVSWPGIREAVVLAREDQPGDKRLVAYLCAEDGAALPLADLRAHLAGHLAPYMVPQAFVVLPALPLTGNGKLDRHALPAPGADALAGQTYVAPEGRLEQGIAAIWQDLLGLERVGRDDNFFERGGHSLMAVQVVVRIGRTLGIATAVRELFVHPVLHELAAALASNRAQVCSVGNLVPIRRGGTQEALFLIHPGEGEVGYVRDLLPHLPTDLPLYGLAADGFLPGEKPLRDIRQMAVRYMQAIRQSQPHGPYRLAGWSAGGTIAYEIACQLEAVGESVSFLGMIDTHFGQSEFSDNLHAAEIEPSTQDLIRALAAAVPQTLDARAQARLATIAASADLDAMLTACQQVGMFPPEVDMATLHRHLGVRYAIYAALCRYAPTTVPTTPRAITLFAATDDCSGDLSLGWRHFIGERLHVVPVPGGHYTVMQATHIARLGVALQRALEGRAMATTVDVAEQSATC